VGHLLTFNFVMAVRMLPHTGFAGVSRLFLDYLYSPGKVRGFYGYSPWETGSYAKAAACMDYPSGRRNALVEALRAGNGDSACLELLARPGTVAVVTGQQVGLFLGPAYTVYKALTAIKLAQQLTEAGLPAVPVFWMATEDHDFAEVNHCWVLGGAYRPVRLDAGVEAPAQAPAGTVEFPQAILRTLREALAGLPFGGEVSDLAERACSGTGTFSQAFQALLSELLRPRGMLFLDPLTPALRRIAAPFLGGAVNQSGSLVRQTLARGADLEAAGYHAQVHLGEDSSLFFLLDQGRRLPMHSAQDGFYCGRHRFTQEELRARAEDLSPNALMRPVMQDYLLPTVAAVMGPAEVAYMAQSQPLYQRLLGRQPVVLPRAGVTVLDSRSLRFMDRYGVSFADILQGEDALCGKIARALVPPDLEGVLARMAAETSAELDRLRMRIEGFDPALAEAAGRSGRKIQYQLGKITSMVARESLRRDARASAEAARLAALVYPSRHLQERFYSILPLLALHGPGLIETLFHSIDTASRDHIVLSV
jgi:bacillithiol biosynthesis cysteine-adding enzyme BshC